MEAPSIFGRQKNYFRRYTMLLRIRENQWHCIMIKNITILMMKRCMRRISCNNAGDLRSRYRMSYRGILVAELYRYQLVRQWRQLNALSVRLRRYVIARPVGSKQSRLNAGLLRCFASRNDVFVKLTPLGDLLQIKIRDC